MATILPSHCVLFPINATLLCRLSPHRPNTNGCTAVKSTGPALLDLPRLTRHFAAGPIGAGRRLAPA